MTQVQFIPALLPDGSLPAESQAFVSQQVQQEAGQVVTDAQAAQAAAEAARDAALAAVPHIIVGAGRPDITGTLAPDIATRVNEAPSGTVFRSTDGPQGAWEWQKRGAAWICTEGELETLITTIPDTPGATLHAPGILLTRHPQLVTVEIDRITFTADYAQNSLVIDLPVGFRPPRLTRIPEGAYGINPSPKSFYIGSGGTMTTQTPGAAADYRYLFSFIPHPVWPTSA